MRPETLGTPTVFIVDDDEAVCRSLAFALDLEGFAVTFDRTAEEFLLRRLPGERAFIVLDERLPGMSGSQALKVLRRRGVDLPAALVTTHPLAGLRAAAAATCTPILEKPLLSETLVESVRCGLAAHQHRLSFDPAQGRDPLSF